MRAGCARVKMATIADLRDPMGQRQSTMVLAHRSSAVLFVLKQTDADGAVMSQSASVEVSHPMMNLPLETVRHSMGIVFGLCWKAQVILARALLRHAAHADSTTMLKSALSVEQGHTWSRFEPLLLLASPLNTSRAKNAFQNAVLTESPWALQTHSGSAQSLLRAARGTLMTAYGNWGGGTARPPTHEQTQSAVARATVARVQ